MASIPNTILGNHTAIKGEKVDCSAMVPKTLSKKIKMKARHIPTARFTPIPPLLLNEETATAIIVRIKAEIGMLHRL